MTFGLVLGGGGGVGVGWEIAVIAALEEAGAGLRDASVVVGTSAGSIVGAQVFGGRSFPEMLAEQRSTAQPREMTEAHPPGRPTPDAEGLFQKLAGAGTRAERARILGRLALDTPEPMPEATYLAMMQAMIKVSEWPGQTRFLPTVVDCETGERVAVEAASGAPLISAVSASCSVPMMVPPVRINGRKYVDGGVGSPSNLDVLLGTGVERAVFIGPFGGEHSPPMGGAKAALQEEFAQLESAGLPTLLVSPGPELLAKVGADFLNIANRPIAVELGLQTGAAAAAKVRAHLRA